jgi:SAM-dependent methyltransferase
MISNRIKSAAKAVNMSGYADCEEIGERFLREQPRADVLLDVGCGDGMTSQKWGNAVGAQRIIGLEFLDELIAKAKANGIEARKADLSVRWPVADEECDVVVSSQNIEHMHRSLFYAKELYRVLRPGGRAVVLSENLASWVNIVSLVFGWQPFSTTMIEGKQIGHPFSNYPDLDPSIDWVNKAAEDGVSGAIGHVRVLAWAGLRQLLENAGFKVTRYETSCYAPAWGWVSRLLCRIDPRHGHFTIIEGLKPGRS